MKLNDVVPRDRIEATLSEGREDVEAEVVAVVPDAAGLLLGLGVLANIPLGEVREAFGLAVFLFRLCRVLALGDQREETLCLLPGRVGRPRAAVFADGEPALPPAWTCSMPWRPMVSIFSRCRKALRCCAFPGRINCFGPKRGVKEAC